MNTSVWVLFNLISYNIRIISKLNYHFPRFALYFIIYFINSQKRKRILNFVTTSPYAVLPPGRGFFNTVPNHNSHKKKKTNTRKEKPTNKQICSLANTTGILFNLARVLCGQHKMHPSFKSVEMYLWCSTAHSIMRCTARCISTECYAAHTAWDEVNARPIDCDSRGKCEQTAGRILHIEEVHYIHFYEHTHMYMPHVFNPAPL